MGAERGLRCFSQVALNPHCGRVRAAEHASRNPCRVLERRHGFAEIVERGAIIQTQPNPSLLDMLLTQCAACAETLALNAKQCGHCQTRYCNATCQTDHWRRGHKQI